jgi:hypothetical protein
MAVLYVAEFDNLGETIRGAPPIALQPPLAEQTVAIGGSTTASSAFNASTRVVRLHTDAICSVEFGTAPTAAATNMRMAAGATEYFAVPVGLSYKVAVITNT